MKVLLKGKEVTLSDTTDFIYSGGEGAVYGKGSYVYKIYHDVTKMLPLGKIDELKKLNKTNILKPLEVLTDKNGKTIGFTMDWIKNTVAMCRAFTNDFLKREGITLEMQNILVKNIKQDIQNVIHPNSCLQVDGNEMNYLLSTKDFTIPYFIDVDSYQTPSYPATAQMLSIKDWHTKEFNEFTDWFAFAIVTFQLYTGIHPFKGMHPGYKPNDFEQRMKDNVSVFNKDVKYPASVRNFNLIPTNYKDWYYKLFEKGERLEPPLAFGETIQVAPTTTVVRDTKDGVIVEEIFKSITGNILSVFSFKGNEYIVTEKAILKNRRVHINDSYKNTDNLYITENDIPVKVFNDNSYIAFSYHKRVDTTQITRGTMINDFGDLYILTEDKLQQYIIEEFGEKIRGYYGLSYPILPNASEMFRKTIYSNVLGKPYFIIPYRDIKNKTSIFIKEFVELRNHKILDAKYEGNLLFVASMYKSKFYRHIFKINFEIQEYRLFKVDETTMQSNLNFVVNDSNTCAFINEEDKLLLFKSTYGKEYDNILTIISPVINSSIKLSKCLNSIRFIENDKMYSIKTK